jgi:sugar (pentulose or hexulose) kinase
VSTLKNPISSVLLDIGGTYIKSAVIEFGQSHPENIQLFETPSFIPSESGRRTIPTEALLNSIEQAIEAQRLYKPQVSRIYTSGQMGGYVLEGKQGFEVISWQDSRSTLPINRDSRAELDKWITVSDSFKETGSEIRPGLPFYSLAILKSQDSMKMPLQPFRSVISFVTSYLTDFQSMDMHVTDAAASGLFSLKENNWSKELTSMTGDFLTFPDVHTSVKKIGVSSKFNLDVFAGVGDQQASLLGAGLQPGKIVVNIGTGGQVAGLHEDGAESGNFQIRPYFFGQKIRTITHLPSGRALRAFVQYCFGDSITSEHFGAFERIGKSFPDAPEIDLADYESSLRKITEDGLEKNCELVSSMFFQSLIQVYSRSLDQLRLSGELLFAGGVGQKVLLISEELSRITERDFVISDTNETTLEGLGILANVH